MAKPNYIVAVLLIACLCGCGVNKIPMDDAYHIPSAVTVAETTTTPSTPDSSPKEPQPVIEYTNVQDTTVTVVIKRK
ncbi:MAG: hypothetical protein IJ814_01815 [Paludibacteraceae bacterium]|nr:hypothetical protein [Paludibacteraceae bacterium]